MLPATTGSGDPSLVIARSAEGVAVALAVAALSVGSGSNSVAVTEAAFAYVPGRVVLTTTVTRAVAPFASGPRLQMIGRVPLQLPWLGVTETTVTAGGRASVRVTPVAASGPLLVTTS